MTLAQTIQQHVLQLPLERQAEVLDFIMFLAHKNTEQPIPENTPVPPQKHSSRPDFRALREKVLQESGPLTNLDEVNALVQELRGDKSADNL